MNPSGRATPLATRRGSMDSTPGLSNAITEATHPQWKNTMSPSERAFVDSQQSGLGGLDSMLYTAPTGLVRNVGETLSQDNPTANSDLLGTVTPEYDAQRRREMNPEPSSIYATPSYLRDKFRFDPDQGKTSTYKDSPAYQNLKESVDRENRLSVEFGVRPTVMIERDENGKPMGVNRVGGDGERNLISGNPIDEPGILDFVRSQNEVLPDYAKRNMLRYMTDSIERRNNAEHDAVSRAVDQENKDRQYQGDVGQGRSSDELIARASSGPAAGTAPFTPLRSPEEQRSARDSQQHAMGADFQGGLPTRAVNLAGETVGDVMNELEVPESFKQSLSFRPGMEFGTPKSRPTAIGANATGIGAGRPERKKETFMDWLRSNFPDSFSDPNSMYYFPGKFD